MPAFEMNGKHLPAFKSMDSFTQGYIEAMFFTECEPGTDADSHEPETQSALHGDCGFDDLAPEAIERIVTQCAVFQASNAELLDLAYARDYDRRQAGRDFWFTRNGHGVGYWDRKELDPDSAEYEALTAEMVANRDNNAVWGEALRKRNVLTAMSIGERLSRAARKAGEVYVYIGDDGRVYHDGGFSPPTSSPGASATAEA